MRHRCKRLNPGNRVWRWPGRTPIPAAMDPLSRVLRISQTDCSAVLTATRFISMDSRKLRAVTLAAIRMVPGLPWADRGPFRARTRDWAVATQARPLVASSRKLFWLRQIYEFPLPHVAASMGVSPLQGGLVA